MAFDYQYSLWGLKEGSVEWLRAKHEVHNQFAYRLQELCFHSGGIYIKLGQHIGQLEYIVPQEYVQTMRASMLKRCPVSSCDQVRSVFVKELGATREKFDPIPLASASLAQVHAAKTHDGEKSLCKDIATVGLVVNFLHWFFPAFDYRNPRFQLKHSQCHKMGLHLHQCTAECLRL
ncbi:putative ABC1 protein At2g40090 isoform X2 [Phoenix dactylifera]|uniref:ABC1 protein At2g40090 isoform X2 n=1 Tax=Phoenix dactylifera TaxID=42345 RepID=A0A8B9AA49_PHODC|nr:putative ABC1 protein At2g40090 isoform X2 [Phoenix dactylifera]